ncbi:MAG: polysaccharide biosynthesis C-terminal domain-containing protein, partial [Candidatus Paceibacterota bacterium]
KPLLNAYQPGYAQSANTLLLILVASSLPNAVTNMIIAHLRSIDKPGLAAVINIIITVVSIALSLILARFGVNGVAYGWLSAQVVGGVLSLMAFNRFKKVNTP